jgi:hypothetical protein
VVSADAWKLREAAISYDIPKNIYAPLQIIQQATLTVSGRNLIMLRPKQMFGQTRNSVKIQETVWKDF